MVPNKIYRTTTYLDNDRGKVVYKETPVRGAENIEYIRKDALLEWAKGEIMPGNSAEGKGWNWALQTLIDKIESL